MYKPETLFEKLNDANYAHWSIRMKALLDKEDCWDVLNTEEPLDKDKTSEWKRKNSNALLRIICYVENSQLTHVEKCKTSKQAWESLKNHHEKLTSGKKIGLFKKLFRTKLEKKDNMEMHICQIFKWFDEFKDLGFSMENEFKAAIIMENMSDYEKMAIEEFKSSSSDTEKLTSGLTSKWKYTTKRENIQYSNYKCFTCSGLGHLSKDCPQKRALLNENEDW